jgi:hypothetical protein
MTTNIFDDDWRDCLREQYLAVVRQQDATTRQSLMLVMYEVGFSEADLRELDIRATMHVDDVPDDFVPDMTLMQPAIHTGADLPDGGDADDDPQDDAIPPTFDETLAQAEPAPEDTEPAPPDDDTPDPDAPQQMSLF